MMQMQTADETSLARGSALRTAVTLDDALLAAAGEAMGTTERSALLHEGPRLILQREAARRLILLDGTTSDAEAAPRHRPTPARHVRRAPNWRPCSPRVS